MNLFFFISHLSHEPWIQFSNNFIVPCFIPLFYMWLVRRQVKIYFYLDSWIIHFINGDNQSFDSLCFHQCNVFSCLTSLFKAFKNDVRWKRIDKGLGLLEIKLKFLPVSNSPLLADIIKIAKSACDAPSIILGTNDLWPGASKIVKC